ncbi:NAD(P)/FAD-dependent oxidoreductase [Streptomyces gulbargensis]|uniref:NAD(P)/FAD-dependent oxidoreductase n=1 Tax=Streptomyces gulbargensis TaxID=364901 RepID=A0ABP7MB85_9ACTN
MSENHGILIVGGGFAGAWAAAAATRAVRAAGARHPVTLVAPHDDLVIRPRLYEAAPHRMRVPLDRFLSPIGVRRVKATVTVVDTAARSVTARTPEGAEARWPYERLVLATGSRLTAPRVPGAEHVHAVDTMEAAVALDAHLRALPDGPATAGRYTAVVVGAGFTGLEVATELVTRLRAIAAPQGARDEVRVVLVDRGGSVGLGAGPRAVIEGALRELGVVTRMSVTPVDVGRDGVRLSDGNRIPARTVVWTAGVEAGGVAASLPAARDRLGRVKVDPYLRVGGVDGVYAAGDVAAAVVEDGHLTMPSCQHAIPMGKYAGHNAAADLLGGSPAAFAPKGYVTCLDLGAAGAVFTTGYERRVELTGAEAKARKRLITERWIWPPLDDAGRILEEADHLVLTGGRRVSPTPARSVQAFREG